MRQSVFLADQNIFYTVWLSILNCNSTFNVILGRCPGPATQLRYRPAPRPTSRVLCKALAVWFFFLFIKIKRNFKISGKICQNHFCARVLSQPFHCVRTTDSLAGPGCSKSDRHFQYYIFLFSSASLPVPRSVGWVVYTSYQNEL